MESLEEKLLEIQEKLMAYALSFTNINEAEDICQSTILKIIENKDQFLSVDNPNAYAKKTMRNMYLDKMKKTNRETNLTPDIEPSFSSEAFDHLEHQLLLECLQKQKELDRTILSFFGSGYSYSEIRGFIGDISESNIRVRASRARVSLAECMGRDHG